MTEQANIVLSIPAYISNDASDDSIVITDPISGAKSIVLTTGYYEFQMNDGTGDGSEATPFHLLKKLATGSTTKWHYRITSDARLAISYTGTGTATFVFSNSHIQNLCGSSSSTLTFTGAGEQTMTYPVYGLLVSRNREGDGSWRLDPGFNIHQITADNNVYGWSDDYNKYKRKFGLRFLPKDQSFKTSTQVGTPVYPVSASTWNSSFNPLSYTAPFTAVNFLQNAKSRKLKMHLGSLPYNGTDEYFIVYQTPESIQRTNRFAPSLRANYERLLTLEDFEVLLSTADTGEASYATGSLNAYSVPTDFANLYAWYKFDNITQSGGAVSQVSDKSGNGRHAVQATVGNRPTYTASGGANNKAYWSNTAAVDTSGKYLLAGVASDWTFLHNGTGFTMFVVQKNTATDAYYILGTQNGSGANRGFGLVRLSSTSTRLAIGDGSSQIAGADFTMTQNSWSKLCAYGDTGTNPDYYVRLNGSATTDTNETGTPSATVSPYPLGIGVGGAGGYSTDASFHEIIIYNRKLSDLEITQIEAYLNDTYGL